MEDKGYSLVFEGTVMPGFARAEVIDRMARRLGKDPEYLKPLFRDKPVTVRKGLERKKAFEQQRIFSKMGIRCAVRPQPEDPQPGDTEKPEYSVIPACMNTLFPGVHADSPLQISDCQCLHCLAKIHKRRDYSGYPVISRISSYSGFNRLYIFL